jgi:hypothetical protein
VRALDCIGDHGKRRRLRLQRSQLLPDQTQLRIRESRCHAPDIPQLTLFIGDTKQQRTEKRPRTARFRPAADHRCVHHENSKFKMQIQTLSCLHHQSEGRCDFHPVIANQSTVCILNFGF